MTRQIRDILIYEGGELHLSEELLEAYFEEFPDRRPPVEFVMTALWRGYVATFEIRDGGFFLNDVETFLPDFNTESTLRMVFPKGGKFDWYSGLIRIDDYRGEFDEEAEGMVFEFLEILNGDFVRKRVMDYKELQEFKAWQFEYFKETADYQHLVAKWRGNNPDMPDSQIDKYVYEWILWHTREVFVD